MAGVDGMEGLDGKRIHPLEDSLPLIGNPAQLREQASRDGFLFFRGLVSDDLVLALRRTVLEYANLVGWLDPDACRSEGRAEPGKRIGYYQDPDWVNLQVHVQNREEMWALGDAIAIHQALNAVESRSSYLCLSTANTCRVYSPHPDMATQPHQDAHYLRVIADFWRRGCRSGIAPGNWVHWRFSPVRTMAACGSIQVKASLTGALRCRTTLCGALLISDAVTWSSSGRTRCTVPCQTAAVTGCACRRISATDSGARRLPLTGGPPIWR